MRRLPLPLALLAAAPLAAQTPHRVVRVSPPELRRPSEVSVAINPTDPDNVVVVALAAGPAHGPRITDFAFVTRDGGATWSTAAFPNPGKRVQGDDAVTFGPDGTAYHSYIAFEGLREARPEEASNGIFVGASADGGRRWAAPVPVIDHLNTLEPFEDKPWIAVDHGARSPWRGRVYVAWTRFDVYGSESPTDSSQVWFSRSDDGGRTFEPAFRISDSGGDAVDSDDTVEGAVPAVDDEGRVYVAWAGPRGIVFDRSLDGGVSFGADRVIAENPGGWDIPVPGLTRHNGMPVTAVDRRSGAVYVAWMDTRDGDTDVRLVRSDDRGDTWSEPIAVTRDDANQLLMWLAVDPVDGSVNLVYLDRAGLEGTMTGAALARSVDGGRTFVRHPIDQPPFPTSDDVFFGDYTGVDAYGGRVVAVWPHFVSATELAVSAALFDFVPGTQRAR